MFWSSFFKYLQTINGSKRHDLVKKKKKTHWNHRGWIHPKDIARFGDTETDKIKLAECLRIKASNRTVRMQEAKDGYLCACSELGKEDGQAVLDSVFNEVNLASHHKKKGKA